MPSIDVMTFRGERPRVTPRLLPNEQAVTAKNAQFERGTLRAYNGPLVTEDTVPNNTKTIFRYLGAHWFSWDKVVDAIYSPVANDDWQRVYYTDGSYPKVTNNAIFNGAVKPFSFYKLGVPASVTGIIATVVPPVPLPPIDDPEDNETRFYTFTYVTGSGEEGPPAPASNQLNINYPASTINVAIPAAPTNTNDLNTVRIYRTATGGGTSDFFFVAEVPLATANFNDALTEAQLGPALETEEYIAPNSKMKHLTLMSNGIVAGAWENTIAFCEPYLPYAWPTGYQLTTEHNVVAMQSVGNNLLVATEGYPWIFYGVSSDTMTPRKVESLQACVSKRSMTNIDGLIIYASPDGLVAFNGERVDLVSGQVFTRKQWQAMKPETIEAYYYEGFYLAFYGTNLDKAFMYSPGGGDVVMFDVPADCAHSDLLTDQLYLSKDGVISIWDHGDAVPYTWRSKEFHSLDASYTCAYIRGDAANIGFKIIVDGVIAHDFAVGGVPSVAFRLPSLRGRVWQFELYGTGEVQSVSIATSMSEIRV